MGISSHFCYWHLPHPSRNYTHYLSAPCPYHTSISCCRVCPLQRTFRFQCFDFVPLPLISNSLGVNQTPSSFWMHFSEGPIKQRQPIPPSTSILWIHPKLQPPVCGVLSFWVQRDSLGGRTSSRESGFLLSQIEGSPKTCLRLGENQHFMWHLHVAGTWWSVSRGPWMDNSFGRV